MIKITKLFQLVVLMLSLLTGCQEEKCIKIIDENNHGVDPSRVYLLSIEEHLSEATDTNPVLFGDGKGTLIGESKGGKICFTSKEGMLSKDVYKIVAPQFIYENAFQYFTGFDSIPSTVVLRKKRTPPKINKIDGIKLKNR